VAHRLTASVPPICAPPPAPTDFLRTSAVKSPSSNGTGSGLRYEPRVANTIIKSMVYDCSNIAVFLKTTAIRPILSGSTVEGAIVQDCVSMKTGQILAKVVIDATDTADFATACGAAYRVGREPRSRQEPHAGVTYFDDPTQAILPGSTGRADFQDAILRIPNDLAGLWRSGPPH